MHEKRSGSYEKCEFCDHEAVERCQRCDRLVCYYHLNTIRNNLNMRWNYCPDCYPIASRKWSIIILVTIVGIIVVVSLVISSL